MFRGLYDQCLGLDPTRELLLDCFNFDPQKWVSVMAAKKLEQVIWEYENMLVLQNWFQAQVCFPNLYIVYY